MKKYLHNFSLLVASLAITITSVAQQNPYDYIGNDGIRDVHNFQCAPNSVFSQIPVEYNIGYYCDANYNFSKVADDYTASAPFNGLRFWGVYDIKAVETFLIEIYDGVPGEVGTSVIHTFNVVTNPVMTPYKRNSSNIYQFDVNFGTTISQLSGWISISRTTLPYNQTFAWIGDSYQGTARQFRVDQNAWITISSTQFFCLTGTNEVPISNWALLLGIFLIGTFIVLRYRRRLA